MIRVINEQHNKFWGQPCRPGSHPPLWVIQIPTPARPIGVCPNELGTCGPSSWQVCHLRSFTADQPVTPGRRRWPGPWLCAKPHLTLISRARQELAGYQGCPREKQSGSSGVPEDLGMCEDAALAAIADLQAMWLCPRRFGCFPQPQAPSLVSPWSQPMLVHSAERDTLHRPLQICRGG